jgi:hypothetical protein
VGFLFLIYSILCADTCEGTFWGSCSLENMYDTQISALKFYGTGTVVLTLGCRYAEFLRPVLRIRMTLMRMGSGSLNADPDPTFHLDAVPDLDPDQSFQIKAQTLKKCSIRLISRTFCHLKIDAVQIRIQLKTLMRIWHHRYHL